MIVTLLLLVLVAVLVNVLPMDGKVKNILNIVICVLAVIILLYVFVPFPSDWNRWPR